MRGSLNWPIWLAIAASLGGCSTFGTRDAVTRALAQGEPVSLMPKPFDPSLKGSEVIRRLEAYGYRPDPLPVFSAKRQPVPEDGHHYAKSVSGLPCLTVYEAVVRVDPSDRLVDVYGASRQMACP